MRRSPFPFHPLLLALYPVASLLATNVSQVEPTAALRPSLIGLGAAAALLGILVLVLRDVHAAATLASAALLAFFAYGHVYDLLKNVEIAGLMLGRHRFLGPAFLLVLAGIGFAVLRRRSTAGATSWLNAFAAIALTIPALRIAAYEVRVGAAGSPERAGALREAVSVPEPAPDIYFIVLDAYTRADVLRERFGVDNSPFLDELRSLGFFVPECSQSNYAQTELTLASTLNLDYLEGLTPRLEAGDRDRTPLLFLIRDSDVRRLVESAGYATVAMETGYAWSEWLDADAYLRPEASRGLLDFRLTAFEALLLDGTAFTLATDARAVLPPALGGLVEGPVELHRERVLFALDELAAMPGQPGPKLVFAHIVSPHRPYVFHPEPDSPRAARSLLPEFEASRANGYVLGYREQVLYLNDRMIPILKDLIERSATPPVILLMGDHGADEAGADERMANLLAVYIPGSGGAALPDTLTPVNAFRIALGGVFGLDLPPLEDRSYYSTYDAPFDFTDVPNGCGGD
jgi:hypothetical protein